MASAEFTNHQVLGTFDFRPVLGAQHLCFYFGNPHQGSERIDNQNLWWLISSGSLLPLAMSAHGFLFTLFRILHPFINFTCDSATLPNTVDRTLAHIRVQPPLAPSCAHIASYETESNIHVQVPSEKKLYCFQSEPLGHRLKQWNWRLTQVWMSLIYSIPAAPVLSFWLPDQTPIKVQVCE